MRKSITFLAILQLFLPFTFSWLPLSFLGQEQQYHQPKTRTSGGRRGIGAVVAMPMFQKKKNPNNVSPSEASPLLTGRSNNGRMNDTSMKSTNENVAVSSVDGIKELEEGKKKNTMAALGKVDVTPTWSEILRKILPLLRPADWKHTALAASALSTVILGKIVNVLPPLAIKHAVDAVSRHSTSAISKGDALHSVIRAILIYFGLKILSMSLSAVQDLCQRSVALDAERRFGILAFDHLQNLGLSYHLEKHVGEVTRILNRGTDSVSTFINSFLFFLAPTIFEAVIVSAVFWKLGTPFIALSTIASVVLYLLFTVVVTKTRVAFRRILIAASDAVGQKETETLVNYETVAMFGRTDDEIHAYGKLRQTYKDRRVEMLSMFALLEFGQKFLRLAGVCAGLIIAGFATVYDNLSPGSFVVVQMYIDQLFQPLTYLGFQYRMLTQAFTDLEKAVTMLNRTPDVRDDPNAKVWNPSTASDAAAPVIPTGEIHFDNVSFHYKTASRRRRLGASLKDDAKDHKDKRKNGPFGRFRASRRGNRSGGFSLPRRADVSTAFELDNDTKKDDDDEQILEEGVGGVTNTSFRVNAGKTTALVGPSGSGKTTLIRLVLRMYDPDAGSVYIDGENVKGLTQKSLRGNIGVVAQETVLFNASLRDNIAYGKPDATDEEIWNAVRTAALDEFVNGLPNKLETLVGERGMKLSGGERQRVGLARCVIRNPQLILLDEATSALDSGTEKRIQQNIADICRGRTTLMIAHRLSTARSADEILVLEKGEICERGTHAELLAKPKGRYAQMWRDQMMMDPS